ncbi:DUF1648 domain-containing protein [Alicyclobacillus sp. SO9]|uniref:DUF1648 domain-containing protein n=1 Tax=Alicyclobacillus sp. SO9 TaxID=2665646 RepID=UPI0018E7177B|nr:DUF1648 domain-containing protein [Alicyclobacillus sp. SO9]
MSYELSFFQALKLNAGVWIMLLVSLLPIVLGIVMWRRSRSQSNRFNAGPILIFVGLIPVGISFWILFASLHTGWRLSGTTLIVKTRPQTVELPLSKTTGAWVSPSGSYGLAMRLNGTSIGQFQTGLFRLNNGKSAIVFHEGTHPWLALSQDGKLALISSPNVKTLANHVGAMVPSLSSTASTRLTSFRIAVGSLIASVLSLVLFVLLQVWLSRRYESFLPEKMTTHWCLDGQANGWMSRKNTLRIGPILAGSMGLIGAGLSVLSWMVTAIILAVQILFLILLRQVYIYNADKRGPSA